MRRHSNGISARVLVMAVALTLIIGGIIGGSVAWLTATSETVTNTFTVGNIDIELTEESGSTYKMVPGNTITKNPKVTVKTGSEACWLFVKIEKQNGIDGFITYSVDKDWTALPNVDNVYYREVDATTSGVNEFYVLDGNTVMVKDTVTKDALNGLTETQYPKLSFTAYAVQKDNINDAVTAWGKLPTSTTNP